MTPAYDTATPIAARPMAATAAMAAALGAFVARPLLITGTADRTLLFATLLALGAGWRVTPAVRRPLPAALGALAAGVSVFGLGRLLVGHTLSPHRPGYVAAVVFAAVAEEAFFRRFVYAMLGAGGAGLAVVGSAVLFALAHVTVYGWWVLPLDLAAGLVFAWQRWATGNWGVPAATHVAANLLIVL